MSNAQRSNYEPLVLELLTKMDKHIELSPKELDKELDLGIEKIIDLFLDLELQGLVKWDSLDLLQLNLERSTKEIYNEVYNSSALITQQGYQLLESDKSEQTAA